MYYLRQSEYAAGNNCSPPSAALQAVSALTSQRVSSAPHQIADVVAADSVSPQLRRSPTTYAASAHFAPRTGMTEEMLKAFACRSHPYGVIRTGGSVRPEFQPVPTPLIDKFQHQPQQQGDGNLGRASDRPTQPMYPGVPSTSSARATLGTDSARCTADSCLAR